jgi:hypothetical protein
MTTYSLSNGTSIPKPIKGRGLAHLKATLDERAALACDAMTGKRPFLPSQEQASDAFSVPQSVLRQHLRARAAAASTVEIDTDTLVARVTTATMPELIAIARALDTGTLWHMIEILLSEQVNGNGQ